MAKQQVVFDDEHTGQRWTYGLTYRPLGFCQVPDGWIIDSNKDHPDFRYGIVDYPFELSEEQVKAFELTEVTLD